MALISAKKVQQDLLEVTKNKEKYETAGVKLKLFDDDDYTKVAGQFKGPPDTPYQGGTFIVKISIPANDYPYSPPTVHFLTKIWHPNISMMTGVVCLNIFDDAWHSSISLGDVVLALRWLLEFPEAEDPLDLCVGLQYLEDVEMFNATARQWTEAYAGGPATTPELNEKVSELVQFGVDEDIAREVLSCHRWDVAKAKAWL